MICQSVISAIWHQTCSICLRLCGSVWLFYKVYLFFAGQGCVLSNSCPRLNFIQSSRHPCDDIDDAWLAVSTKLKLEGVSGTDRVNSHWVNLRLIRHIWLKTQLDLIRQFLFVISWLQSHWLFGGFFIRTLGGKCSISTRISTCRGLSI